MFFLPVFYFLFMDFAVNSVKIMRPPEKNKIKEPDIKDHGLQPTFSKCFFFIFMQQFAPVSPPVRCLPNFRFP
jgi:hypothetical protein